jgi:hypothetical protein
MCTRIAEIHEDKTELAYFKREKLFCRKPEFEVLVN